MPPPAATEQAATTPLGPLKFCSKCKSDRPPAGGVQRTREKWHCGRCWRLFAMRRKFDT